MVTANLLRLLCFFVALAPSVLFAQTRATPKRVLVLYWYNKDYPGNIEFDDAFQAGLRSATGEGFEYYPEYFENNRFPGAAQELLLRDYLRQKYTGRKIDIVVAVTDPPFEFLLKYRADLFPTTPIVFVTVKRPTQEQLQAPPGLTGIILASTYNETIDLALKLHPDTQQMFVISGTPGHDKRYEQAARIALADVSNRIHVSYLTDLPLAELIDKTKSLPPRSIILWLWQQSLDEQGVIRESGDTLALVAKTASVPIYGMASISVGRGIVGGYVTGSEANGTKISQVVSRIFNGARPQDIPVENAPAVPMFDWRQLKRWRINESQLPPGSIIRFKEFTLWERYKWRIIGIATLFGLQTLFIGILLVERGKRRRAREALDKLNAELEERVVTRTAALDSKSQELETFAYSVAHDLKAPLRGIDGYTRLLIEDHSKDLGEEGRVFLETIHNSTREMSQLIDDLLAYSRVERREFKHDRIDIGPLVLATVEQKKREVNGDIDFVVNVNGGSIVADPNGIVQALRNYLDNAVKFTSKVPQPRIEVGSRETADQFVLWVRDNGVGFDMKYHDRIFDIFQRLNPADEYPGTGVGLAIVRKAIARMGGRAWAESEPGKGATFYLEIPKG